VEGVPHRLINVREVRRERVERRVPLEAVGGEKEDVGQDESPEEEDGVRAAESGSFESRGC